MIAVLRGSSNFYLADILEVGPSRRPVTILRERIPKRIADRFYLAAALVLDYSMDTFRICFTCYRQPHTPLLSCTSSI